MTRTPLITRTPTEHALLVAVEQPGQEWAATDSLEELARLAETVEVEVVGSVTQKMAHPRASTYVGKGKLQEIVDRRADVDYDVVMVDADLSPAQQRNLEKALDVKVIDRTALILDVFARRAVTHEGRLQVELAQMEYRLPRLTGLWTHLSRQGVGGVGLRGPGETQLESDRRELGKRIVHIKRELDEVHVHRQRYRDRRRDVPVPVVALVGYTNAGKSTLLNTLTGADVMAEDKLFATLDPTTRRAMLPGGREVLFTDTVGFINNLPTLLVAAFRATLEEINEATVLLHVVDATHPNAVEQINAVNVVLEELGADNKPMVVAFNKMDQLVPPASVNGTPPDLEALKAQLGPVAELAPDAIPFSGLHGWGLDRVLAAVEAVIEAETAFVPVELRVPYNHGEVVNRFHSAGRIESMTHDEAGTTIVGHLPAALLGKFAPYVEARSPNGAVALATP